MIACSLTTGMIIQGYWVPEYNNHILIAWVLNGHIQMFDICLNLLLVTKLMKNKSCYAPSPSLSVTLTHSQTHVHIHPHVEALLHWSECHFIPLLEIWSWKYNLMRSHHTACPHLNPNGHHASPVAISLAFTPSPCEHIADEYKQKKHHIQSLTASLSCCDDWFEENPIFVNVSPLTDFWCVKSCLTNVHRCLSLYDNGKQ